MGLPSGTVLSQVSCYEFRGMKLKISNSHVTVRVDTEQQTINIGGIVKRWGEVVDVEREGSGVTIWFGGLAMDLTGQGVPVLYEMVTFLLGLPGWADKREGGALQAVLSEFRDEPGETRTQAHPTTPHVHLITSTYAGVHVVKAHNTGCTAVTVYISIQNALDGHVVQPQECKMIAQTKENYTIVKVTSEAEVCALSTLLERYDAETKEGFVDEAFPPTSQSVGPVGYAFQWVKGGERDPSQRGGCTLLRPGEPTPLDIDRGCLDNRWLCSVLASLAEHPEVIRRVFTAAPPESGPITLRVCLNSLWCEDYLDRYLPGVKGGGTAMCRSAKGGLWVSMMEKYMAKRKGGYHRLANLKVKSVKHAMETFSGCVVIDEVAPITTSNILPFLETMNGRPYRATMLGSDRPLDDDNDNWEESMDPDDPVPSEFTSFNAKVSSRLGLEMGYYYSVLSVSPGVVTVRNPWVSSTAKSKIDIPIESLHEVFNHGFSARIPHSVDLRVPMKFYTHKNSEAQRLTAAGKVLQLTITEGGQGWFTVGMNRKSGKQEAGFFLVEDTPGGVIRFTGLAQRDSSSLEHFLRPGKYCVVPVMREAGVGLGKDVIITILTEATKWKFEVRGKDSIGLVQECEERFLLHCFHTQSAACKVIYENEGKGCLILSVAHSSYRALLALNRNASLTWHLGSLVIPSGRCSLIATTPDLPSSFVSPVSSTPLPPVPPISYLTTVLSAATSVQLNGCKHKLSGETCISGVLG